MTDPRQSLPDVILTDKDGERLLARCPQLLVQAARGGEISCIVDCELMPVRQEVDGVAVKVGRRIAIQGFTIPLTGHPDSPPPELAQALAVWMAGRAPSLAKQMPDLKDAQP